MSQLLSASMAHIDWRWLWLVGMGVHLRQDVRPSVVSSVRGSPVSTKGPNVVGQCLSLCRFWSLSVYWCDD